MFEKMGRWLDTFIALTLFVLCLAVYNATLTPSLSYKSPDGNELATICYTLGLAHSTGYPLYTWLGNLFTYLPVGDVAHRVNLMSAVLGAGGISLLYLILRTLTRRCVPVASHLASIFGALLFAFSLTFWSQTGIAEVYAANLCMVALILLLLLRWARARQAEEARAYLWFWVFALVYGLSLGTHLSNLGFAPAFALFVFLVDRRILLRPRTWLVGALLFGLALLQFLWLPYKANTLNDTLMLRNAPSTLEGVYNYTLGAFPQFKFAFPLQAMPERIVLYLGLLAQNFSVAGILMGLVGMVALLWQAPRRFFLLVGLYLVQVFFFVQYRAFDIDVFFIPAHFIYAILIGYGLAATLQGLASTVTPAAPRLRAALILLNSVLAVLLALGLVGEVTANWARNDYSTDTAINDFYENVYDLLPPDSALLGRGGVFGYDMFYFRLVYDYRPDVSIPMLDGPRPSGQELAGRPIYTTEPITSGRGGGSPWSFPPELMPGGAWSVPLLLGQSGVATGMRQQGQPLTLYAVQPAPPDLVVAAASPQRAVGQQLGALELVGYDLDDSLARPGGRLHLTLYWRGTPSADLRVATSLGDLALESHPFGLGLLARYIQEVRPLRDGIVVEDYWLVLPSTLEPGEYPLNVHLGAQPRPWAGGPAPAGHSVELEPIIIAEELHQ
ncbi:MAG: DUF2723 domain-containing protein [Anaerolineae bacterium]|jgi:hypothetical protein